MPMHCIDTYDLLALTPRYVELELGSSLFEILQKYCYINMIKKIDKIALLEVKEKPRPFNAMYSMLD